MDAQIDPANSPDTVPPPTLTRRERRRRARLNGSLGASGRQRGPNPLDPLVDDRQVRAFDLRVTGLTLKQIAQQLGVNRETAQLDIAMEGRRRSEERGEQRVALIEAAAARYERSLSRLELRAQQLQQLFTDELRSVDDAGNAKTPSQNAIFKLTMSLAATERAKAAIGRSHDRVLGLVPFANLRVSAEAPSESASDTLTDMIEAMTPEQRCWIRNEARRLRQQRAAEDAARDAASFQSHLETVSG